MLNRRTLRIKGMQTIFAFQQSKGANYGLAQEFIKESFAPDLNSMEVQDKELLNKQKQEALQIFEENYKSQNFTSSKGSVNKVNEVVNEAIRDYYQQIDKDFKFFKKNMVIEAEKVLDRYISILNLLIELGNLAESDAKQDHSNFVKNLLIKALKFNKSLENISLRRNISWDSFEGEVRQWFKELIKTDEAYISYRKLDNPSFEQDKDIVNHIVKNILFKNDLIDKFMEEKDLNWNEDRPIIKSLTTKTIKSITEDFGDDFELQELSYNWEDDKAFFIRLFEDTIKVEGEYEDLIAKKTKNWDIERIATTDKIILEMAICEMINFPSIPVKVTINEYIEVAKRYSTPKSKTFINGVLDVIASELTDSGAIRKSGRGLIDNK
ncbi:transcription antitermination factor NusB [Fulvivirga sp. 29W222]|uniref:Transcription antitermination factor NusB n=1 Tax=Fulvivirga marina TaxID=2494733 RepID=A0A937FX67_9BACT|nr:transcription antitermination factor NusB [Fulvivirga marina]MBL6446168.1 transcription antitermination factor NusB [Fulvivirga marina]